MNLIKAHPAALDNPYAVAYTTIVNRPADNDTKTQLSCFHKHAGDAGRPIAAG
jgi:hypothetical protein